MKIQQQYSDEEVIAKVLQGEIALFEVLIRRYNPFLYKVGRSYNYSHADTQDLMQDTFVNTYTNLAAFEHRSSFNTWIIKIMLNNCYRKKQKMSFKNEVSNTDTINEKSIPMYSGNHQSDTTKIIMNRELNHVIENSLATLTEEYRMVFSLREITGLSTEETAESLNITETNVKARLSRAKAMLRKDIEKSYTAEEIFEFNLVHCDTIVCNVMKRILSTEISIHTP